MKSLELFTNFIVCSDSQNLGIPISNPKVDFKTTKNKNKGWFQGKWRQRRILRRNIKQKVRKLLFTLFERKKYSLLKSPLYPPCYVRDVREVLLDGILRKKD